MRRPRDLTPACIINLGRFKRRLGLQLSKEDHWIWTTTCVYKRFVEKGVQMIPVLPLMDEKTRVTRNAMARRWAWEQTYGPIIKGHSIQNVCGEPLCVRPDPGHNRPITHGGWMMDREPDPVRSLELPWSQEWDSLDYMKHQEVVKMWQARQRGWQKSEQFDQAWKCKNCGSFNETQFCPKCAAEQVKL